ncbi:MAG: phosphate ABC transporter permease subunit PstC [Asgard group archaeon]|nr:phosphate ABC transporter permease subunit PstC [Asgard group archaeon]
MPSKNINNSDKTIIEELSDKDNSSFSELENQGSDEPPELEIIPIGIQKLSWQRILLLVLASLSIIILILILAFILVNGIQIIPFLIDQYVTEHPDEFLNHPARTKFVAFFITSFDFLFRNEWNPSSNEFGIVHGIVGTFLVVIIAMVIAIPISIGCAVFMAEIAPPTVRNVLKPTVELLASIPSIVYGFFGLFAFVPAVKFVFNLPFMVSILGNALPTGETALSGGLVLSIMVIPTIVSITDDALQSVPKTYKEGSYALGATKWQTIARITIPAAMSGIFAATILAFGRAIGETMAVLMVAGGSPNIPSPFFNILSPVDPLTSLIARGWGEAENGSPLSFAIFATAIVLFFITFIVNLVGDVIVERYSKKLRGA